MRRTSTCFVLGLALFTGSILPAAESPSQSSRAAPATEARNENGQASQGLIPFVARQMRLRRNRYPGDEGKNHTMVKAPFREVVAGAGQGTLQVLCDDKPVALGTVIRADGYVLTKASELTGKVACRISDKQGDKARDKTYSAEVVGIDDQTDLALLKIDANGLTPVPWSRVESPGVGSFLASAGIRSEPIAIGVVSVAARTIAPQSGMLGIQVGQSNDGPRVDQVLEGTSAERAGLQVNDIIVRINDRVVTSREAFIDLVGGYQPGDRVRLKVRRGEETLDISTTLGSRISGSRRDFQNRLGGELSERRGGFSKAIQHDTVLRPRDCGGPLVDLDGQVVGINIARAERVATYAIPTPVVLDVIDKLMPRAPTREASTTRRVTAARPVQ
jgi:serine protease Do